MSTTIDLPGGTRVPVPSWTRTWFGLIAVASIAFAVYRVFYPMEPELVSVRQANEMLRMEVEEYNRHILDAPMATLDDPGGHVAVRLFHDGCLIVWRKLGSNASTKLLIDPSRGRQPAAHQESWPSLVPSLPAVHAATRQGRCINPHPGRFRWFYGVRRDACWLEVVREFEDGCVHVQLFNGCTGTWAANPDGSPQVRWTRCVH